jgi:hypothetical protein
MNPLRRMVVHPLWDADEGPARPLTPQETEEIARVILERHLGPSEPMLEPDVTRFLPRRRWRWIVLAAAAMLLTLGALAATVTPSTRRPNAVPRDPIMLRDPVPTPSRGAWIPNPTIEEPDDEGEDAGAEVVANDRPRPTAVPSIRPSAAADPESLWEMASSLRAERRWREAAAAYERVVSAAPHGSRAYTARVLAASLRLEHLRDPGGALTLYRAALTEQPGGALSEEIRWGVVECFHALADFPSEREALRSFAATHPDSPMHGRAEARISELEGSDPRRDK